MQEQYVFFGVHPHLLSGRPSDFEAVVRSEEDSRVVEEDAVEEGMEVEVEQIDWVLEGVSLVILEDVIKLLLADFILLHLAHHFGGHHESFRRIVSIEAHFQFMASEFSQLRSDFVKDDGLHL